MCLGLTVESLINSRHLPKLVSEVTEGWLPNKVLLENDDEFLEL